MRATPPSRTPLQDRRYNIPMATTTAIVTHNGLVLPAKFMAELNLQPGVEVVVAISEQGLVPSPDVLSPELERLIQETPGMFATAEGGMSDELIQLRREEEHRSQSKEW